MAHIFAKPLTIYRIGILNRNDNTNMHIIILSNPNNEIYLI